VLIWASLAGLWLGVRRAGLLKAERGADAGPVAPRSGAALIISKWAGHYDSAFTQKTYVHASEGDLQRGHAALARIHKIA
jgi:integrase